MKVLFLEIATEREWALSSIGPACLASYLRKHGHDAAMHAVEVDDTIDSVVAAVAKHDPGCIGLSLTTRQWLRGAEIVKALREHVDLPVVAGGLHPTFS